MAITGGSTHQVSLSWSDTTSGVTFNIYRGTAQGGETLYASGQPSANYVDSSVVGGTTYWYYVTAVLSGDESAGSNEVSAAVPNNPPPPSGLTVTSVK
jgi:fibronectin type 3 domain-containing protein